jgi:purine-nucleoside phosphorylase
LLKDLTRDDWLGFLDFPADRVPHSLILRGTRNLRSRYLAYLAYFEDTIEVGSPNGLFEDVFIGRRNGVDVAYASVYGPAMASEIAHVFGVLGTTLVIQSGVCGGLADGLNAGDLVIATAAGCGDGASVCYLPGVTSIVATETLTADLLARDINGVALLGGPIWTTAALLAEGDREINEWHAAGFFAADLETAATFAVAEYFGMQRVSILSVFDNPRQGSHLAMTESDKQEARARGEAAALELVLDLATNRG